MEDNKEADNSPQTETTITKSSPGIGRLILRVFLLVVIPIIAVVFGAQWYEKTGRYVETENAYVKTNVSGWLGLFQIFDFLPDLRLTRIFSKIFPRHAENK